MPLSPGQVLNNRYRIVKLLGQGGFGAVYRAWDINMERPLALKENLDTTPEAQRQFKREAQILFDLSHPNLPRVMDHFVIPAQGQYLVMEFVEGEDLREMLQRAGSPLPEAQTLEWIGQVCDALEYLHSQNPPIVHRDIKPANIKITPEGKAVLVDFGIAKVYDPHLSTTAGARAVTPGFSPHEQYGVGTTDARTDIYALGATLYTLLTNQQPPESIQRVVKDPLVPPEQLNPSLSQETTAAIMRAIQMDPDGRFQNMVTFKIALQKTSASPEPAAPAVVSTVAIGSETPTPYQPQAAETPMPPIVSPAATPRVIPWAWIGGLVALAVVFGLMYILGAGSGADTSVTQTSLALGEARSSTETALALEASTRTAAVLVVLPSDTPRPSTTPVPSTATSTLSPTSTSTITPSSSPSPIPLPSQIEDENGVLMALIPAGPFEMGGDADVALVECQELYIGHSSECKRDWYEDEEPIHNVTLEAFYIDVYEVTNARYAECVNADACNPPRLLRSATRSDYYGNSSYDDYPVIYVTWDMAKTYCEWRGARLPTEAEWEKAARGGLEGKKYPWGDEFDGSRANFCDRPCLEDWANADFDDGHADTAPVGSYAPNGYGLYDIAGNVWERVADWHASDYYSSSPSEDPTGPSSGEHRVSRGGSWSSYGSYLWAAFRIRHLPDRAFYGVGLRCARSSSGSSQSPTPTLPSGTVQGQVLWDERPVEGAKVYVVDLYSFDSTHYGSSTTDASGIFSISGIPNGEQYIYVHGNQPEFWVSAVTQIQMVAGTGTSSEDTYLCKGFDPISPKDGEEIYTSQPILQWSAYPDAVDYAVRVVPVDENEFVFQRGDYDARITSTSVQVDIDLKPGEYNWRVDAFNAAGHIIGCSYYPRSFKVTK